MYLHQFGLEKTCLFAVYSSKIRMTFRCHGLIFWLMLMRSWLEGFVKEKNKDDKTTLTIYFSAVGDTLAMKMWHLWPARTWHLAMEAAKEKDKLSRGVDIVESKQHEEFRPLPLSANKKEFYIGMNTRDNKLDGHRAATGLQKEGSMVVFGISNQGRSKNSST